MEIRSLSIHAATTIFFGLNEMPGTEKKGIREIRYNGRDRAYLAVLSVLVVLHVAKAAAFIAAGQGPLQGDSLVYWSLGERVAAGDWRLLDDPPEVTRTPGYPYYVAFFQLTCGRWALAAAIASQHLLILGTVTLAAWTCWRLTGRRSAVFLCLLLALGCFSSWGVAVNLLSDTLLSFLLTLSVALAVAWRKSPSHWKAAALGLAPGAAVLTKPVAQYAGLIAVGWMLFDCRGETTWRRRALDCAVAIAVAAVVVAPWLVRNELNFGQPFLSRVGGRALWWSCFKDNPGGGDPPIPFADGPATRIVLQTIKTAKPHDTWPISKELVRLGYTEIAADELMLQGAKEAIRAHPWNYFVSRCRRYVWFWLTPNETFRPNTGDFHFGIDQAAPKYPEATPVHVDVEGQATWSAKWYFQRAWLNRVWHPHPVVYALAVLACVVSIGVLAASPGTRGVAVFFGLWLGYFSAGTTLFGCPAYRYRMILEPAMIVLAVTAWETLRASRRRGARSTTRSKGQRDGSFCRVGRRRDACAGIGSQRLHCGSRVERGIDDRRIRRLVPRGPAPGRRQRRDSHC